MFFNKQNYSPHVELRQSQWKYARLQEFNYIILSLRINNRYGEKRKGSESAKELSGVALLSATLNQCRKPNQQLLIPITVWIGMEQAFIGADFTQVRTKHADFTS